MIEGHKLDVVNSDLVQQVGRPPRQDEMKVYRHSMGHGPEVNPERAVETRRAVCIMMEGCTLTFDAGTNGKGSSAEGPEGAVEPCRIKVTFPEKGTAILWGHAAKTLRISLHDQEKAAFAIGNCRNPQGQGTPGEERQKQSFYAKPTEEQGDYDECGDMTAYRRAAAEAPKKGRRRQAEGEDEPMEVSQDWRSKLR